MLEYCKKELNQGGLCAAQAAREKLLAPASQQHPLWLTFQGADLEGSFAAWHSIQLQKVRSCLASLSTSPHKRISPCMFWFSSPRVCCICVPLKLAYQNDVLKGDEATLVALQHIA